MTTEWFNTIHSNVTMLMSQSIVEANHIMSSAPNSGEIKHIGWLSEQVSRAKSIASCHGQVMFSPYLAEKSVVDSSVRKVNQIERC